VDTRRDDYTGPGSTGETAGTSGAGGTSTGTGHDSGTGHATGTSADGEPSTITHPDGSTEQVSDPTRAHSNGQQSDQYTESDREPEGGSHRV